MKKTILSHDGVRIAYEIERGGKRFAVLLHGAMGNSTLWREHHAFLKKLGLSVISIDLRAHGLSGSPRHAAQFNLEHFARDVHAVLVKEKVKEFILIGHCFGGVITLKFHELYPTLAKRYVLINTMHRPPRYAQQFGWRYFTALLAPLQRRLPPRHRTREAPYEHFRGSADWHLPRIYFDFRNNISITSWFFTFEQLARFDATPILPTIKQPTLIIHGRNDAIISVHEAKVLHQGIKGSRLRILPAGTHLSILNTPHEVDTAMAPFLEDA